MAPGHPLPALLAGGVSARHPGAGKHAAAPRPSDLAPDRPDRPSLASDKLGDAQTRAKLGAVRQCTPLEYLRLGLYAADYATDVHPAGSPEADELGAELLDMLGVTDNRRLYLVRRVRAAQQREAAAGD